MFNRFGVLAITGIVVLLLAAQALAGVTPSRLNYQGLLTDSNGRPLNATSVQMTFRIWDHPYFSDPTNLKWEETLLVDVIDGLFTVILGDNIPIDAAVFDSSASYLGIQIGSDAEGSPRTRLVSVGYSTRVETLDGARGGVISGTITLEPNPGTKAGEAELLRYEIFDDQDSVRFWASTTEVFTPCIQFAADGSRQCTATVNSGAAQSEVGNDLTPISSALTVLAQQSIDCPSDGYVLVLASCEATLDLTNEDFSNLDARTYRNYAAEFGVSQNSSELPDDQHKSWSIRAIDPFRRAQNVMAAQKVFSVGAGSTTFYFLSKKTEGEGEFSASEKTVSLIFVPKAYGAIGSGADRFGQVSPATGATANASSLETVNRAAIESDHSELAKLKAEIAELRSLLQQIVAGSQKR